METSKRILLFGLSALLVAALAGCGKKVHEEPQGGAPIIEALVGIGPVRFGMSKDEVVRYFGSPDRTSGTDLNYVASKGLAFTVDDQLGLQKIKCWSDRSATKLPFAVTTFAGMTKEGIGMGATRERIVAAYGPPSKTDSTGGFENLYSANLGAKFTLLQGALASMILEAPKERSHSM